MSNTLSQTGSQPKWLQDLITRIGTLSEELTLSDMESCKLREFVTSVARAQYMAGNKSGIAWARRTPTAA